MPNDYIKKEPTKTEKFMYELAVHQQNLENQAFSNSRTILAVALALGVDAEKLAGLLTDPEDKVKEFGLKVNAEIDKIKGPEKESVNAEGDLTSN